MLWMYYKVTIPLLAKLAPLAVVLLPVATLVLAGIDGFPIHDFWFDCVMFMLISSLVGGMPEPDVTLPFWRFMYLWAFRSGHLLVSAATAYFLHQSKWPAIRAGAEAADAG
jgi:hypothetical protein